MAYIYNIPFINYFISKIGALLGHKEKTVQAERSIHPIVHQYHSSRSNGAFLILVVWLSLFYNSTNVFMWNCILSYGLIWPHVAFAIVKQYKTPKKAELNNLLLEAANAMRKEYQDKFEAQESRFKALESELNELKSLLMAQEIKGTE